MDTETSSTQETSNLEAAPAQETDTTTTTSDTTTSTQNTTETVVDENWEYKGDRNSVPKNFENYVKGLDRYWTKKSQTYADIEKKAQERDSFIQSEDYKAFQQFKNSKTNTGQPTPSQPQVTQDELDAIALGDAKTLQNVIQREVARNLEANLAEKEKAINERLSQVTAKQNENDAAETIKAFADVHPDFWDLYDNYEDYVITSARGGKSLEKIYESLQFFDSKVSQRLETKRQAALKAKKDGSVVGQSVPGTPDVVYADTEDQAKRLAVEFTLKGDKRHVQVKSKKK